MITHIRGFITPCITEVSGVWGNVGALIIRIGSWGILYYKCDKEPPK